MRTSYDNFGGQGDRRNIISVTSDLNYSGSSADDLSVLIDGQYSNNIYFVDRVPLQEKSITFHFTKDVYIDELRLRSSEIKRYGQWKIQGSNNGVDWIDLSEGFELIGTPNGSNVVYFTKNMDFYTYYRLRGFDGRSSSAGYLWEFEFKSQLRTNQNLIKSGNGTYKTYRPRKVIRSTVIPVMTSNTSPKGRAFAKDSYSASYDPWNAFNGYDDSEGYASANGSATNGYLGYEFEQPIIIGEYLLRSPTAADTLQRMPKDWTFEGSNDGISWFVLDTQQNQTWTSVIQDKIYEIKYPKLFKMYRINWTANNGFNAYTDINELKMFTGDFDEMWVDVPTLSPTEDDFKKYGMYDLSVIPEEAWAELSANHSNCEIITYVPHNQPMKPFKKTYMDFPLNIHINALPDEQLVVHPDDFELHGSLDGIIVQKLSLQPDAYEGKVRIIVSFDKGTTWEAYHNRKWKRIDIADLSEVAEKGMSLSTIDSLGEQHFSSKGNQIRIAYYLDNSIHREEEMKLAGSKLTIPSSVYDFTLSDLSLQALNTLPFVNLTFAGNKLIGKLEDPDGGKVQYRILLNGRPYFPVTGQFTSLASSPIDINISISEKDLIFNQENLLKVEFQDYWGQTEFWETKFIGTYSGLMFMDESGHYYSDTFGGILQYLDFDVIIAGQTTLDKKVIMKNQLGHPVTNLKLNVVKDKLPDGVTIELSRASTPFIASEELLYSQILNNNDTIEFYVRISTKIGAKPVTNGIFEIRAHANRV